MQQRLIMQQRFVVRRRQRLRWWLWRVWRIMIMPDRFGLGWRHKLALGILSHLDRIDIVEVIADDYFRAPHRERRALRTLAAQTPITLHGVTLVSLRRLQLTRSVSIRWRGFVRKSDQCLVGTPGVCAWRWN